MLKELTNYSLLFTFLLILTNYKGFFILSGLHTDDLRGRLKSQDKNFICDTCGRRFAFSCLLRDHINTHTGVKPYLCQEVTICINYSFHFILVCNLLSWVSQICTYWYTYPIIIKGFSTLLAKVLVRVTRALRWLPHCSKSILLVSVSTPWRFPKWRV